MDDLRASLEQAFKEAPEETQKEVVEPATEVVTEPTQEEVKESRTRTPDGKFAPKESVKTTETPQDEPIEEVKAESKPSPKSWRKEVAEKHWNVLDPELQEEILRREEAVEKGFEGYKSNAEVGVKFKEALQPYMATINGFGAAPEEAVKHLFNADHQLRYGNQQQKTEMVLKIFNDYGIDPNQVFQRLQNGAPQVDPAIAPYIQKTQALEAQLQQFTRAQEQREMQSLNSDIERAKVGKPHFDLVREEMAALLQAGLVPDLDSAYDRAIWARPDLRQSLLQQERDKAASELQAKRAQSAAVSVKGSTPSSTTSSIDPNNLRGTIASQFT